MACLRLDVACAVKVIGETSSSAIIGSCSSSATGLLFRLDEMHSAPSIAGADGVVHASQIRASSSWVRCGRNYSMSDSVLTRRHHKGFGLRSMKCSSSWFHALRGSVQQFLRIDYIQHHVDFNMEQLQRHR